MAGLQAVDITEDLLAAELLYFSIRLSTIIYDSHPLRDLLPSQIDYGKDVTACQDLWKTPKSSKRSLLLGDYIYDPSLESLLPPHIPARSLASVSSYWQLYIRHYYHPNEWTWGLPYNYTRVAEDFRSCCENNWTPCEAGIRYFNSSWYTKLDVRDLNTSDCFGVVQFSNTYLHRDTSAPRYADKWWNSAGAITAFHQLLPDQHKHASAQEVQYVLNKFMLQDDFLPSMTGAADRCQPEYCVLLNFDGNADIAGKGVSSVCIFCDFLI